MKSIRCYCATACVVLVIVTACGSKKGMGSQEVMPPTATPTTTEPWISVTTAPPAARGQISIDGYGYTQVTVPQGAQVTVANKDPAEHTVTSDAVGEFDTYVAGNGQATLTAPYDPGSYPYHCRYHVGMHGMLVVQ